MFFFYNLEDELLIIKKFSSVIRGYRHQIKQFNSKMRFFLLKEIIKNPIHQNKPALHSFSLSIFQFISVTDKEKCFLYYDKIVHQQ